MSLEAFFTRLPQPVAEALEQRAARDRTRPSALIEHALDGFLRDLDQGRNVPIPPIRGRFEVGRRFTVDSVLIERMQAAKKHHGLSIQVMVAASLFRLLAADSRNRS